MGSNKGGHALQCTIWFTAVGSSDTFDHATDTAALLRAGPAHLLSHGILCAPQYVGASCHYSQCPTSNIERCQLACDVCCLSGCFCARNAHAMGRSARWRNSRTKVTLTLTPRLRHCTVSPTKPSCVLTAHACLYIAENLLTVASCPGPLRVEQTTANVLPYIHPHKQDLSCLLTPPCCSTAVNVPA